MYPKKSRSLVASAVSLALSSMMLSGGLNAGVIDNLNNTSKYVPGSLLGTCGTTDAATEACVGAWDLGNVTVKLFRADGTEFGIGTFNETDGTYETMLVGDSFSSVVNDWDDPSLVMAKVGGKVWPIGEPTGIKAVYGDDKVKNGKPANCIINTAYLDGLNDADKTTDIDAYLGSEKPEPVICSSGFQTHKRFKIAMQPDTFEAKATTPGAEGRPIDLVFKVTDSGDGTVNRYQVFSKINNYTNQRLSGYKIVVGTGVGAAFKPAAANDLEQDLFISLGLGEGMDDPDKDGVYDVPNGLNLFDDEEGLATFSRGLFGPEDTEHVPPRFPTDGFFDKRYAGFNVVQSCSDAAKCATYTVYEDLLDPTKTVTARYADTIVSDGALPSNYVEAPINFGDWLHSGLAPMGIFFDPDSDPSTDNDLMAYWNGTQWIQRYPTFTPVDAATLNTWAADPRYTVAVIEDTLNLGINYIVNVGDDLDNDPTTTESKITIRIIPIAGDQTQPTPWMTAMPEAGDLLPVSTTTTTSSSGGGGCATGGSGRFDPTLPALLAMGLGFFGWRRCKSGK